MVYIPSIASSLAFLTLAITYTEALTCTVAKSSTDDAITITAAFDACKNGGTVVFPKGATYNLKSLVEVKGLKNVVVDFQSTINLPDYNTKFNGQSAYFMIKGDNIRWDGKNIGTFNGNGQAWWDNKNNQAPCIFRIGATVSTFSNFKMYQAPRAHMCVTGSTNVAISGITLNTLSKSKNPAKNTDALDISSSNRIAVKDSNFTVGDDCTAMNGNVSNVVVKGVTCTNGHGFSIGSLGKGGSSAFVSGITITDSTCINCQNGVRIKAWPGGKGSVSRVKFQNVVLKNVDNPVMITTHYCDNSQKSFCTGNDASSLSFRNVDISGLTGSVSASGNPIININCSTKTPCTNFTLSNINLAKHPRTKANTCVNLVGSKNIKYC